MAVNEKESKFSVFKIFGGAAAVIAAVCAVICISALNDKNGVSLDGPVTVEIPSGAGSAVVADTLHDAGVIKYPILFRLQSKKNNYDGQYQPGSITVTDGMSYSDILNEIVKTNRDSETVSIPEGYEARQIAQTLQEAGIISADEFMAALDPSLYNYKFLEGIPSDRPVKLEGYLFPATYSIPHGYTAVQIVDMMLGEFDKIFTDDMYQRAKDVNITVDEAVIMASIIERETNSDTERAKVAGVFYNRINSGMNLQSCATVQYILGERKPVLSIADTQIDSPYNTYKYPGLPVGPIANPGEACIRAALYPEKTDAFYFCLSQNGEHIFSKTYEEHLEAMNSNGLAENVQ